MGVVAKGDYQGEMLDKKENFHGNQVTYLHWEEHLSFCAPIAFPFPPDMPFGAIQAEIIPTYYGMHPDFDSIDWQKVEWSLDGRPFTPDPAKSIGEQGFGHKSVLRFRTLGLNGYQGSAS